MLLEEKSTIPAVREQLAYLAALQDPGFWEGLDIAAIEDLRLRLRELVPFLDRRERHIVYSNFKDEVLGVRDEDIPAMPKMTGAQYEKKVKEFLRDHPDHLVIHRLRNNLPLTATDLAGLEQTLTEIGEDDGAALLGSLLTRSGAPSLAWFVRSLVGMDRAAAQAAFSGFLSDRSLKPKQIRFVEMIIDQLTARGVMDASALYEPPFIDLHSGGPDGLFGARSNVVEGLFETLASIQSELRAKDSAPGFARDRP